MSDITTAIRDRETSLRATCEAEYGLPGAPQNVLDAIWNIAWGYSWNLGTNALHSNYQFVRDEISQITHSP